MSCHHIPLIRRVALVAAAFLLLAPAVMAGGRYGNGSGWATTSHAMVRPASPQPAVLSVPRQTGVSATVTMRQAEPPFYAVLRGPDGQTRRFPVEGGRASITYTQVVVHPGQSVTIYWSPAR
jgi:hypothetical protein